MRAVFQKLHWWLKVKQKNKQWQNKLSQHNAASWMSLWLTEILSLIQAQQGETLQSIHKLMTALCALLNKGTIIFYVVSKTKWDKNLIHMFKFMYFARMGVAMLFFMFVLSNTKGARYWDTFLFITRNVFELYKQNFTGKFDIWMCFFSFYNEIFSKYNKMLCHNNKALLVLSCQTYEKTVFLTNAVLHRQTSLYWRTVCSVAAHTATVMLPLLCLTYIQ